MKKHTIYFFSLIITGTTAMISCQDNGQVEIEKKKQRR